VELSDLTSEQIELVRSGASPLYGKSIIAYYSHVQETLRGLKVPSSRAVVDAVQSAQRQAQGAFRCTAADGDT
jgi:hypothetical protein